MGLLALTDLAALPGQRRGDGGRLGDHGVRQRLAFTAIAEIAGPFWSGRALGTQNTSQLLTAGIAPPLFGALIAMAGYPRRSRCARCSRLIALPLVPVERRSDAGAGSAVHQSDRRDGTA